MERKHQLLFVGGKKHAPTIPSCWYRYFMKKHHLNVKGGFTLYVVCKDKSHGSGIGGEPSSAKTPLLPARSFVNVVPWTHRKGLQ